MHINEFKRTAAQVTHYSIGFGNTGDYAQRRVTRLFLACQDIDAHTYGFFRTFNERRAIFGFARGGGCHGKYLFHADLFGEGAKTAKGRKGAGNAAVGQFSGNCHALAQAAQNLFIEHRRG